MTASTIRAFIRKFFLYVIVILCLPIAFILFPPAGVMPGRNAEVIGLQHWLAIGQMSLSMLMILGLAKLKGPGRTSWVAVNLSVVAIGVAALTWLPRWSGLVVAAAFVPFVLTPLTLAVVGQRRGTAGRVRAAAFYTRLISYLHPSPQMHFRAGLAAAQARRPVEEKVAAYRALAARATPDQIPLLNCLSAIAQDDWPSVLEQVRRTAETATAFKWMEIRALGEIGHIDEMIAAYAAAESTLKGVDRLICQLFVLSFSGRLDSVRALLSRPLRFIRPRNRAYWSAIAAKAARLDETGETRALATYAHTADDETFRQGAQRHLAAAPRPAALSPESTATIAAVEETLRRTKRKSILITLALVVLVLAAFAAEEHWGGATDRGTLIRLGALSMPLVQSGQWWRLATSPFLHAGWFHLFVNLYLLIALGLRLELRSGSRRMLAVCCLGALASSLATLLVMWRTPATESLLVGVSGIVFALLGCGTAQLASDPARLRALFDWRNIVSMGPRPYLVTATVVVMLWIDVAFELHELHITATTHIAGFVAGLAIGVAARGVAQATAER